LRTRLAALFSPIRIPLGGAEMPRKGDRHSLFDRRQWVVPRASCQYRQQDFSNLPARQRPAAAKLVARQHAPAPGLPVHIVWCGSVAHFWTWVPGDEQEALSGVGNWLPESVLLPPPPSDGARLLQTLRGYEGQLWQGGVLVASQWWQGPPALDVWQRFLRGASTAAVPAEVPVAEQRPWSDKPWGKAQRSIADGAARERMAWTALLLLGVAAVGWQLAALQRWSNAQHEISAQLDMARAQAAPVLAARDRAEAARTQVQQLLELGQGVNDYVLMADIAAALPEGSQFMAWRREPGKVRLNVRSAETDPRTFVNAFSALPQLATVTATPLDGGLMQLEFTLSTGETPEDAR
ncbi:MAG: hypothetical protein J0H45_02450, partial [Stenotrophomonas nitritireducens]|nr:hypothetical protein [Stenotrophomonas nitritireducens]